MTGAEKDKNVQFSLRSIGRSTPRPTWNVKKKFNSLRTNFRKELKKMRYSKKSGAGTDEIYDPTLWYFNEMSFLQDQ